MRFARDAAVVLLLVLALPVVTTVERAPWQRKGESATQTRPHA
jgi:hypothetical protein